MPPKTEPNPRHGPGVATAARRASCLTVTVRLTRLSPTHHRFAFERSDGSGESAVLESKSLLLHDLAHFALEAEAGLARSFYGLLAAGHTLADIDPREGRFPTDEARLTERIVGPLTGVLQGRVSSDEFLAGFARYQRTSGEPMVNWLTADLLDRTIRRFRALHGRWKATPFRGTLEFVFPPR